MSENKIKIRSLDGSKYQYHVISIKIEKRDSSGTAQYFLLIHEEGQSAAYEYQLSTTGHVAFKVKVENNTVYYWEKQTALSGSSVRTEYDASKLTDYSMSFGVSSGTDWLALKMIGSDDARIGLFELAPGMGHETEIGFKLHETKADWLVIESYFPSKV